MKEWQTKMTAKEFAYWLAYFRLEPRDPERSDLRTASIVQAIYNASPNRRKGKSITLADCVLDFGARGKKMTRKSPAELFAKLSSCFKTTNKGPDVKMLTKKDAKNMG